VRGGGYGCPHVLVRSAGRDPCGDTEEPLERLPRADHVLPLSPSNRPPAGRCLGPGPHRRRPPPRPPRRRRCRGRQGILARARSRTCENGLSTPGRRRRCASRRTRCSTRTPPPKVPGPLSAASTVPRSVTRPVGVTAGPGPLPGPAAGDPDPRQA
jgi:hypothetical protein